MSVVDFNHGTDRGPVCRQCNGTIWAYGATQIPGEWAARCVACHKLESFQVAAEAPSVVDVRSGHEIAREAKPRAIHADVEFQVDDKYFRTFEGAAVQALLQGCSRGEATIDVLVWSAKGAAAYGGDDAVERYREDPDASVFERYEIKVSNAGMVP